jgi:hypothetical protein
LNQDLSVGGVGSGESSDMRAGQSDRLGRHWSRTPRNRIREAAVSLEKGRDQPGCSPNGTRFPDGSPPAGNDVDLPPVPPFPVAPAENVGDGHQFCSVL